MPCNINKHILEYIEIVQSGKYRVCKEQKALIAHVIKVFATEDIYTDDEQLENYLGLAKYFPYDDIFAWEKFLIGLHDCTYRKEDNRPRWPKLLCMVGRGAGKDGFIALEGMCLTSPYNNIQKYDYDICANNEEQAMTPVRDLLDVLETPAYTKKLKKHYYWSKEHIFGIKTKSTMKGRTNSPKGKDGLRSGKVAFNEIHQYENYDNINVFTTGLGKKPHPRRGFYSSQGDVRDGPLDDLLNDAERILFGGEPDDGFLPFICRLDDKKEVHDEENWTKANPSLPYLPHLLEEIRQEYKDWIRAPETLPAFMTKRFGLPDGNEVYRVTDYDNIKATNREIPSLEGKSCVVGIDYANITDFASVNLHFKIGNQRYDINHSWLCKNSKDLHRIKPNWKEWANRGLLTVVDEKQIDPDLLSYYIAEQMTKYNIIAIALDNARYKLVSESLFKITGFDCRDKEKVKLVKPTDIMGIVPVIESNFISHNYIWGDNPVLRWATNNTAVKSRKATTGVDTGNRYYVKIEARSRKTDPFMAFVASVIIEDLIFNTPTIPKGIGVYSF